MDNVNRMELKIYSISENESFARMAVSGFATRLDPTIEELADIKTAVSEAVTNCIVHGYENTVGIITIECSIEGKEITVVVTDEGVGIEDVNKAMEPLYSSKPEEERSGMGFSFMEIFMDELWVWSMPGKGTKVTMKKVLGVNK